MSGAAASQLAEIGNALLPHAGEGFGVSPRNLTVIPVKFGAFSFADSNNAHADTAQDDRA